MDGLLHMSYLKITLKLLNLKRVGQRKKTKKHLVIFMLIYNGVNNTSAKEAWETLEFANEGSSKFRMSRLQLPTTKFQNLKIKEEETNVEFNV